MSELIAIETGLVELLGGLEHAGGAAFATVRGLAARDRRAALEAVSRWTTPAVAVAFDGRERPGSASGVPGDPRFTLLILASSLRSADGARIGDVDAVGAYALAGIAAEALDGAIVSSSWRLGLVDEQIVAADERQVAIEQRWVVQRLAESGVPAFGGQQIAGPDAVVSVQIGECAVEVVSFAFPGVDGAFRHTIGRAARTIEWSGWLREPGHEELTARESDIERLVGDGRPQTMTDTCGRDLDSCVVERFRRLGSRRIHPVSGIVAQRFELHFTQLGG